MSRICAFTAINLGGEGEVAGIINQQRPAALAPGWRSCVAGVTLEQLANQGQNFLICANEQLPLQDESMDLVSTNSVPIDIQTPMGPGIQSSEVRRILRTGGQWVGDGQMYYTKP